MVFAHRPAPVQISWLGYTATTGMRAIDYRITDHYAEPAGMTEHLNTEALWRLPEIFLCYEAHEQSPAVIDHPPFIDNGYITFGCFNNFEKISDQTLETWACILENVPNSRLFLEVTGSVAFIEMIKERLPQHGIPRDRLIVEQRKKSNQFILYNKIDIALDPFPCVGGTTSMDTMWMGVPFVTLAGKSFTQRMGVSISTNAGLSELIAASMEDYIAIATGLATDRDRLTKMRDGLRNKISTSPLMNQAAFTKNMEDAFRAMWPKYCGA